MKYIFIYNRVSVADVKMKWTKIRIAYMRTLRQSYQNSDKKRYYLAKYMKFIKPTKYIKGCSTISENSDTVEQGEEINNIEMNEEDESLTEYESEEHLDEHDLNPQHVYYLESDVTNDDEFGDNEEMINDNDGDIDSKEVISSEIKKMSKSEKQTNSKNNDNVTIVKHIKSNNGQNQNKSGSHYRVDNLNHQKSDTQLNSGVIQRNPCCESLECNPRKMFLFSLMPDIQKLSESQMRSFRRQVIQILDDVMSE